MAKLPFAPSDVGDMNRRSFLKVAGGVTGAVVLHSAVPRPLLAQFGHRRDSVPAITDPAINALVFNGVQAARDAGAQYVDVRLTHGVVRDVSVHNVNDFRMLHVGVRALVNGYWGFASGPLWTEEAVVSLARRAAVQAQETSSSASLMKTIDVAEFPKIDVVRNGHWEMPVKTDPLSVHPFIVQDYLQGLSDQIPPRFGRKPGDNANVQATAKFFVQERAFGSSEGSYCTQRLYLTSGTLQVGLSVQIGNGRDGGFRSINLVSPSGSGWELFSDQPLCETGARSLREIRAETELPAKPATPGKFNILLDAVTVARALSQTVGAASEIDRALGYEANSTGMSYLNDPANMLGKFPVGAPMLTVTANRSESGGAATVKWDDEGVAPRPFTIVKDGVFHDYHLSRDGVMWLRNQKVTRHEQPHGVVQASQASHQPHIQTANLEMKPSSTEAGDRELMEQAQDGVVFEDANISMDPLRLNGMIGGGRAYEFKGGKKVARIINPAVLVYTPELWKSLHLLGGERSKVRTGHVALKGEPVQASYHSVTAVPAVFREQTVFDMRVR